MSDHRQKEAYEVTSLGYPARLLEPGQTYDSVTDTITSIPLGKHQPRTWYFGFAIGFLLLMTLFLAVTYLLVKGVGIWGINIPVAWGFAIVNFVWWIGIGHAGTFISAILLLLFQQWRTGINRFTEAMTLFAVACAGLFPLLHLGRPWVFYWILPYPDTMGLWPQFRSPLVWDVFAVGTYFTVSLLFWYLGLLPDLASVRDKAQTPMRRTIYGFFALGWRGSTAHWQRHQSAYLLLAGLATPLVLSVHSVVSFDFSVAIVPGWHSTIFPPYFVAGAIYSGFAMVLNIVIPVRKIYKLEGLITMRYLNNMANVMLVTGQMVAYGYLIEAFMAWYSGDVFDEFMMHNRLFGPVRLGVLGADAAQCRHSPIALVAARSHEHDGAVSRRLRDKRRHVGGALRYHHYEPASRFHSISMGYLHPHDLGLGHALRQHGAFPYTTVPIHPLRSDDLDF